MSPATLTTLDALRGAIARDGFVFARSDAMRRMLEAFGASSDWNEFCASWDDLPLDDYMNDGGRYRRRRHATYACHSDGQIERRPHQAHFQSLDYNPLNGGIARWFEPLADDIGAGSSLLTILGFCRALFGSLAPSTTPWHVEVHCFRIEARSDAEGRPTPEGMHRDGVDFVLVLLVRRVNIESGTTTIDTADGRHLRSFTLTDPLDAALVDDARVLHGVTPVVPLDPMLPAYRDVLVVTFRRP